MGERDGDAILERLVVWSLSLIYRQRTHKLLCERTKDTLIIPIKPTELPRD